MEPTPRHVLCIIGKWVDFSLIKDVLQHSYEDFTLEAYEPHPAIKAPIAV